MSEPLPIESDSTESAAFESATFHDIGSAVLDSHFPEADLALRRGRHIDRDDGSLYQYLLDAEEVLSTFYQRFGCELVYQSDGYFYLLPTGDQLGKRHLSVPEMIVGQGLALLYLEPQTVESGGVVTWETVVSHLASVMGTAALVGVLNPKRKRLDERVAQQTVRSKVQEALRKLATMGFVVSLAEGRLRLRSSLMRFAEPVRGTGSPEAELRKLVERGEVALEPVAVLPPEANDSAETTPVAEQEELAPELEEELAPELEEELAPELEEELAPELEDERAVEADRVDGQTDVDETNSEAGERRVDERASETDEAAWDGEELLAPEDAPNNDASPS